MEEGKAFLCDTTIMAGDIDKVEVKSNIAATEVTQNTRAQTTVWISYAIYILWFIWTQLDVRACFMVKKSWNRDDIEPGSIFLMYKPFE